MMNHHYHKYVEYPENIQQSPFFLCWPWLTIHPSYVHVIYVINSDLVDVKKTKGNFLQTKPYWKIKKQL